ncbi:dihydrofolate reductase family protein [Brevibacterium oceani]|uniref:dihydrofolate reductase family protein n=1 Tax=Brevibacterium oceani TaxID=358099 RepID=UPI002484C771|nr:dihydrofolate reductase family protein [Brevibacterium oceani]
MCQSPTTVVLTAVSEPFDRPDAAITRGDAADGVATMKEESEVPIRSHGSLSMSRALMAAGLADRLQITVDPVITGQAGAQPVVAGAVDVDIELLESTLLDGDIRELGCQPRLHGQGGRPSSPPASTLPGEPKDSVPVPLFHRPTCGRLTNGPGEVWVDTRSIRAVFCATLEEHRSNDATVRTSCTTTSL